MATSTLEPTTAPADLNSPPFRPHRQIRGAGCGSPDWRVADRHRRALPVGTLGVRVRQLVLLGRGAGRIAELEGLSLRLPRCRQRHHRRQAAGLAVADGPVGTDLRAQLVEHPGAAGAARCGHGWRAVRLGAANLRARCGAAGRRDPGPDPGGGIDVPLQQSRCPAGLPDDGGGLPHPAGGGEGERATAGRCRCADRFRVPDEDAAGLPGAAGLRPGVPDRRADDGAQATAAPPRRLRRHDRLARLVGRHRRTRPRLLASVRGRFGEQLGSGSDLRLQRPRPDLRPGRRCRRRSAAACAGSRVHPAVRRTSPAA